MFLIFDLALANTGLASQRRRNCMINIILKKLNLMARICNINGLKSLLTLSCRVLGARAELEAEGTTVFVVVVFVIKGCFVVCRAEQL